MSNREILDFVVRHSLHRSIKAIAATAMADIGNLHASLAGRRLLPPETLRRVAAAVGLRAREKEGVMQLDVEPGTVINLEVSLDELQHLSSVLQALSTSQLTWRLMSILWTDLVDSSEGSEAEAKPGVYSIAVAYIQSSYVLVHINWPSLLDAIKSSNAPVGLMDQLKGQWHVSASEPGLSINGLRWIRIRSGMASFIELDALFGVVKAQATGEDWARLLTKVSQLELSPDEVIHQLTGV